MAQWKKATVLKTAAKNVRNISGMDLTSELKLVAYHIWAIFNEAPTSFLQCYSKVPEADYIEAAAQLIANPNSIRETFNPDPSASDDEAARYAGTYLRAADEAIAQEDFGSRPRDANKEWRIAGLKEKAFFIPLSPRAFRSEKLPKFDFRTFDQRGLLKNRIIPGRIDGADVRIVYVEKDHGATIGNFAGVLYPDLAFDYDNPDGDFVVTDVVCPKMIDINLAAIRAAHEERCSVTIFPELTINPQSLASIVEQLEDKPWLDDAGSFEFRPKIVVAGSWHRKKHGKYYNVATVLDGDGEVILEHYKRLAYRDNSTGRAERIAFGKELAVLVLEEGLFGFGTCLDYCHEGYATPYGALDVDFVLVPSCGNNATMESHVARAAGLNIRRKTRAFVVQQAEPQLQDGHLGFILPPNEIRHGHHTDQLKVKATWNISATKDSNAA